MSKKTLVTLLGAVFAIAIYWLGFINGVYYHTESKSETEVEVEICIPTDEEIMNLAIAENYGQGFYGELFDDGTPDEYVTFEVYSEDGVLTNLHTVDRGWYEKELTK